MISTVYAFQSDNPFDHRVLAPDEGTCMTRGITKSATDNLPLAVRYSAVALPRFNDDVMQHVQISVGLA